MIIDATFWVAISFFIFVGVLIYLKIPQKVNNSLSHQIDEIKKELNEAEKLKVEAKNLLSSYENKIDKSKKEMQQIITLAKKGDHHSRRMVARKLPHKNIVKSLFNEIAPKYVERAGGYTRIIKLGYRDNDRAPVSIIEFVDMVEISTSEEQETDAS